MPVGGALLTYAMLVAGRPADMQAWKAAAAARHSGSPGAVCLVAMHLHNITSRGTFQINYNVVEGCHTS